MEDNQSFLELRVDEQTEVSLMETSRWAKFLGVIVLACVGIFVVLMIAVWSRMEELISLFVPVEPRDAATLKVTLAFVAVLMLVIVTILMTFLLKGAKMIRTAIQQKDSALFTTGLGQFRNYFAMMGILNVIAFLFLLLGLLAG